MFRRSVGGDNDIQQQQKKKNLLVVKTHIAFHTPDLILPVTILFFHNINDKQICFLPTKLLVGDITE